MGKEVGLMNKDKLLEKQIYHKNKAAFYSRKVKIITRKEEHEESIKLIGKCFDLSPSSSYGLYCRIESFDKNYALKGTKIEFYGKGQHKHFMLTLNASIYDREVEAPKPISKSRFNKYLSDFYEALKQKMG